jgi:hypothetical protein
MAEFIAIVLLCKSMVLDKSAQIAPAEPSALFPVNVLEVINTWLPNDAIAAPFDELELLSRVLWEIATFPPRTEIAPPRTAELPEMTLD